MRTLLAIPSKGQVKYLPRMLADLCAMSVKPDRVLYMLDRPSASDIVECRKLLSGNESVELVIVNKMPDRIGHPQMVYGESQFLAGHVRELAINYMLDNGYDAVVFTDGDCLPEPDLVKEHVAVLDCGSPAVSVGQRKEFIHDWADQRLRPDSQISVFFDQATPVEKECYFVDSGVVWTCNFGMNRAAVLKLRGINNTLYGREETFLSDFHGTWGGEDGFIGMECFYTAIPVIALPLGPSGVKHQFHTRESDKYQHDSFIDYLESHREQLLYLLDRYGLNVRGIGFLPREDILKRDGIFETES